MPSPSASFRTSRARARSMDTVTTELVESAREGVALGVGDMAGEYVASGSKTCKIDSSERLGLFEGNSGVEGAGLKTN